jgi:hypothetical protein
MRRILGIVIAVVVVGALIGPVAAVRPEPRVTIIVGPVGELTDFYRSIGAAAAREARRWTGDVVSVVSPDATWPAVKRALRGASIVVYLGHGNGWPSPYRDALYPATQDGLGLNPVSGGGDIAHQYFGEAALAREIRLAPGAVVLLHHLCYASGNSEPGLPEGSLDVARQRIDNYAAGWLAAGAGAVIADTFGEPAPYIRALLSTDQPVERIWRGAPTFHGHVVAFASTRTPGVLAEMDPTRPDAGFNRSIVARPGLDATDVRSGAGRVATLPGGGSLEPPIPSLGSLGVTFRAPGLVSAAATPSGLVAGTRANLSLPVDVPAGVELPHELELGVRWDPLSLGLGGSGPSETPLGSPSAVPAPAPDPTPSPGQGARGRPLPGAAPTSSPAPEPPPVDAVAPEVLGSVVSPVPALLYRGRLLATIQLPASAGLYRLVTTIHGADGVAFDSATQTLVAPIAVRVSRQLSAAFGVAPTVAVEAGSEFALKVRVVNDGAVAWADDAGPVTTADDLLDPRVARIHPSARLVGRWVALGSPAPVDLGSLDATVAVAVEPGSQQTVELSLIAPAIAGPYLLVLDIDSPLHGSLAASGVEPGRVLVTAAAAASPGAP